MITVEGKYGIKATVLKHSATLSGSAELVTFEIQYPRLVLSEMNTHRALSKNSASSRAIPFDKMLKQLVARPTRFGESNKGMQDKGEDYEAPVVVPTSLYHSLGAMLAQRGEKVATYVGGHGQIILPPTVAWEFSKFLAVQMAEALYGAKYHKQIYNRLLEPFQMMKTVISGTEWANFFWLRHHEAADPTIAELARVMYEAYKQSVAEVLQAGEWHLPYIDTRRDSTGKLRYGDEEIVGGRDYYLQEYTLEQAIKISCARCAAVSFRNVDYTLEKSEEVYDRLVGDERKHASAFEHCATPMKESECIFIGDENHMDVTNEEQWLDVNIPENPESWEEGISHMDRNRRLWSGNIRGFIQYRKLIPGENYEGEF